MPGPQPSSPRRTGALLAPLVAGFLVASVVIVLLVGWMRHREHDADAGEPAPAAAPAPAERESSWAPGAAPTAIGLDLAYGETTYEVTGRSAAEIFASIDRNAPATATGRAAGLTRLVGNSYDYAEDHGTGECWITHVHASLDVTLPELQTGWSMPEQLLERWTAYARSVELHERQHVGIYRARVERAVARLERDQPFEDKRAMERAFTQVWSEEMALADEENEAFHRREVDATRLEREVLGNELARTQRELDEAAARMAEYERAHPDLRMPADTLRRYREEASRLAALQAEHQRLAEERAWLR